MTSAPAPNPAVRFLSWYRGLFARGGKWIAVALLFPCCALSALYGGAQSLGIIETPPTSTPAPTRTPKPTSTTRPTDVPPPTGPPTAVPVPPQPVMQVPPPVQPTAAPPVEAAVPDNGCVDINAATFDDLRRIIDVDEDYANQIIALRSQHRFRSVDELTRVNGIGAGRLRNIKAQGLACVK